MKVEKGVPLPSIRKRNRSKYPYKDMDIGDSFFVKFKSIKDKYTTGTSIRVSASRYAKANKNFGYTTETTDDGIRVWRIA